MIRFQEDWYRNRYPHVAQEVEEGLWPSAEAHYFQKGSQEGLSPSPYFDEEWYRSTYPEITYAISRQFRSGLHHYLLAGAREGRSPGPAFDENSYLAAHPDVAAAVAREECRCGYEHFLLSGEFEGRTASVENPYRTRTSIHIPVVQSMPMFSPLCVEIAASKSAHPRVNLVLPSLLMAHMSGGPNTAVNLVARLAAMGVPMRFLSSEQGVEPNRELLWNHIESLTGIDSRAMDIELGDASNPGDKAEIGENDIFFGTAWWTVQKLAPILPKMRIQKFLYLIQDYEPGLSAWSTEHSMALETYSMDMVPVVNSHVLRDHFIENRVGRFADRNFAGESLAFEPAIDRNFFFPEPKQSRRPNRLLFYARPLSAHRNLFELGVCALHNAALTGLFSDGNWELRYIGDAVSETKIGNDVVIRASPWMAYSSYARLMRNSDVLLSLMLSPHPSYPPLEMAACGGVVVTNNYGCKTQQRMSEYGSNIFAPEPTVKALVQTLTHAANLVKSGSLDKPKSILPATWAESFEPVLEKLFHICMHMLACNPNAVKSTPVVHRAVSVQQQDHAAILYPGEGEVVGTRPEFYIAWAGQTNDLVLRLYRKEDYFIRGDALAEIACTIVLRASGFSGVLLGEAVEPIPEGGYIVSVTAPDSRRSFCARGFEVHSSQEVWQKKFQQMLQRQAAAAATRQSSERLDEREGPLFSITTTVYNTHRSFLEALVKCIKEQSFGDFEWLILDNGSTVPDVSKALRDIASSDKRIRLFTVTRNLHIIGGNRYLVERAKGEYIIPIDSDDLIYPDALAVISRYIEFNDSPGLLFSDEQKISLQGAPAKYIWRPEWSTLYCQATCPASHLMIFKRGLALQVEAYGDDYARGSHDWDTALRLHDIGVRGVHIPEVLYGWRMHPASAALNDSAKNYIVESQMSVVRSSIARRGLAKSMEVEPAHWLPGYYHVVSHEDEQPPVLVNVVLCSAGEQDIEQLRRNVAATDYKSASFRIHVPDGTRLSAGEILSAGEVEIVSYSAIADVMNRVQGSAKTPFSAILYNALEISRPDWLLDAVTTFALDETTGIVGGCITTPSEEEVQHIGYVAGLDSFFATPGYGVRKPYVPEAIALLRRHVTAVYGSFVVIKSSVWEQAGAMKGFDTTDGLYGIEFCLRARELGVLTAYTPRMAAVAEFQMQHPAGSNAALRGEIVQRYGGSIERDPYYSAECSQSSKFYGLVTEI